MINKKVGLLNTIYTLALFALNVTEMVKERNYPKNLFLHTIFLSILFWGSANIYMGPTFLSVT